MPLYNPSVSSGLTVATTTISGGSSGNVVYDNAGVVGEIANTGTGSNVLATSPTLVTPTLGAATATSIKVPLIGPSADSTTAIQITKADLATRIVDIDTTNARVGINKTPGAFDLDVNGTVNFGSTLNVNGNIASTTGVFVSSNTGTFNLRNGSTVLSSPATATLQLGTVDAATPVAQIAQVQSVVAGTSNVAGQDWTFNGSRGTGTGAAGKIIFKTALANAAATVQNTLTTALALVAGTAVLSSYTVAGLPAAATAGAGATAFVTDASTTLVLGLGGAVTGGGANKVPVYSDGTSWNYG